MKFSKSAVGCAAPIGRSRTGEDGKKTPSQDPKTYQAQSEYPSSSLKSSYKYSVGERYLFGHYGNHSPAHPAVSLSIISSKGYSLMKRHARIESADLERREFHLSLFASSAIVILAAGLALLMYPAVFSNRDFSQNRTPQIAFFGFCGLSCLLVAYIVNRQITIRRLRYQMAIDRKRSSEALRQASADLLGTLPNFNAFEDRLSMEVRRAASANLKLSVLVVKIKLHGAFYEQSLRMSVLGDAAKAISRKLREQDSNYLLRPGFFGIILPGVDTSAAQRVSARLSEGLSDAAGANDRFSFKIDAVSYPEQTASAHDLELAVCNLLPEEDPKHTIIRETHAYR
jgi:GGDEF domain-containing protein